MPPLWGNAALRGRSRDIVSQVEDKLKLNNRLPREILEATRSSLRVLKIRNPIGCFGKYDNETKRACALLEYDVRDYNTNNDDRNKMVEVPMEKLAKAAFMKLKDFRDFHEKIGNFRDNLRVSTISKSKSKGQSEKDKNGNKNAVNVSSQSGIVFRKSSIPSLAIQLGAFVPNSSGAAMRAQKLFTDVVHLLKNSSKKDGIYGLRDLQKNQSSYEAACFYLVATSNQDKDDKNSAIRRRRRTSRDFDEGEENQHLDLKTFVDITKVTSQFQAILDYVGKLKDEIESKNASKPNAPRKAGRSRPSLETFQSSQKIKANKSRKRSKKEAFDINETISSRSTLNKNEISGDPETENAEELDSGNFIHKNFDTEESNYDDRRKRKSRSNATFHQWKAEVLREAYEDARQKMSAANAAGDDCEEKQKLLKPQDLLDFVVREILERNGL